MTDIGQVHGGISAAGIENADFSIKVRGYDRDEVDSFLTQVAAEVRHLLERMTPDDEQPYQQLGSEAGRLLQLAKDAADEIRRDAELEATQIRTRAAEDRDAAEAEITKHKAEVEQQVAQIISGAETDAAQTRDRANHEKAHVEAELDRLKQRAEAEAKQIRSQGKSEYTVLMREAKRNASTMEKEARQHAEQVKDSAEEQALDRVQKARAEVRRLREMEASLKQRIQTLSGRAKSMERNLDEIDLSSDTYSSLPE